MVFRQFTPRRTMDALRNEMDRLLTNFLPNSGNVGWPLPVRGQPAVNIWDQGDALVVEAEIPGVKDDQVEITVVENELTLKVQCPDVQPEGARYHRRERPAGELTRVLRLPVPVNADRVSAGLHDGVLTITLPKAEGAKPRKIHIGANG